MAAARLYAMRISNPANAVRLMLEHKGIPHDVVWIQPGMQAARVRLAGFPGSTVPALKIGRRKVVGSRTIARLLDEVQPQPPLFPADPAARAAVEEAEAWGEEVLQPVPRRLIRRALLHDHEARLAFLRGVGSPAPAIGARMMRPVASYYANLEDARSLERIRTDWTETPAHLDHVDELIAAGVLDGELLNAADFQIATTLRVMLSFEDFAPLVAGRPAERLARRVWPDYGFAVPSVLPPELRQAA